MISKKLMEQLADAEDKYSCSVGDFGVNKIFRQLQQSQQNDEPNSNGIENNTSDVPARQIKMIIVV